MNTEPLRLLQNSRSHSKSCTMPFQLIDCEFLNHYQKTELWISALLSENTEMRLFNDSNIYYDVHTCTCMII